MKTLILLTLVLSGCSSLSEYRRGCQDGISESGMKFSLKQTENFCELVEQRDKLLQKQAKETKR
jgi:uncharacterized protein YceK